MSARDRAIDRVTAAITAGRHVELVGAPGSGRSAFLDSLAEYLAEHRWEVHGIFAAEALAVVPFGALALAGFGSDTTGGSFATQLQSHVAQLAQQIQQDSSVLLIDNVDELDDASWAAIVGYSSQHPRTRVITTSKISTFRSGNVRRLRSLTVEVPPLTYRELRAFVESKLSAPLDDVTLGQIFTRSGASASLAYDLVDASLLTGHLRKDGTGWSAHAGLWSPELAGSIADLLAPLNDAEQDALEILAIAGVSDLDTIHEVLSPEIIEKLEELGLARISPVNGQLRIAVHPPLLEDFFGHRPFLARRDRLTGLVAERLQDDTATTPPAVAPTSRENAVIARLFQEQAQTRMRIARSAWETAPTAENALLALRALVRAEASDTDIEVILNAPPSPHDTPLTAAHLLQFRAEWMAFAGHDLAGALELLRTAGEPGSIAARVADIWSVSIEQTLSGVPDHSLERLTDDSGFDFDDRLALLRAQVMVQTTQGDFTGAHETLLEAEHDTRAHGDFGLDSLRGVVLIGLGDIEGAIEWSERGYAEALTTLNTEALRNHSAVLVYAFEAQGRYAEAEDILATVSPLVHPARGLAAATANLAIHGCAALIAARSGKLEQAERHLESAATAPRTTEFVLHQSPAEAEAQLLVAANQRDAASDLLWERGAALCERGYCFAGVLLRLAALEVQQDEERLAAVKAEAAKLSSRFVDSYVQAITYFHTPEAFDPIDVATSVHQGGRPGLALAILDRAIAEAKSEDSNVLREARTDVKNAYPDTVISPARFLPERSRLTGRELEVARLAAEGMSNSQIATRLVVSVRTVESHIHRIIRKLGVASRHDIDASHL